MGENTENPINTDNNTEVLSGIEKRKRNLRPWKKGEKVKGAGRPLGAESFETKMLKAVDFIAKNSNSTTEEVWNKFYASGLTNGMKGNFPFFKEVIERLHGVVIQKADITTNGKDLSVNNKTQIDLVINNLLKKDENTSGLQGGTGADIKQ
jgi:hypothetical protein